MAKRPHRRDRHFFETAHATTFDWPGLFLFLSFASPFTLAARGILPLIPTVQPGTRILGRVCRRLPTFLALMHSRE